MTTSRSLELVPDKTAIECGYKRFIGELWTAQQRQMHSLHYVVSYRASFKPELPEFCIQRYSKKGDIVLDPFTGRGTTALQANLLGRIAWACDINPLAVLLTKAKTSPVGLDEIVIRLNEIDLARPVDMSGYTKELAAFYHPETFRELMHLRTAIKRKPDTVSRFIELLAVSRLHGHSPGFFSVYSFPQISIPPERQHAINLQRRQEPEFRAVAPRIIKKAAQALRDGFARSFFEVAGGNAIECADARNMRFIPTSSVDLIITSPPFLDKVDYIMDNWLEFWFTGIKPAGFKANLVMSRSIQEWSEFISAVLREMLRVLKPGGYAVVEVGEVEKNGETLYLDEVVAREANALSAPEKRLLVEEVLVNQQSFTKLANCFNVDNNQKGTNTNRLVVIRCQGRTKGKLVSAKKRQQPLP